MTEELRRTVREGYDGLGRAYHEARDGEASLPLFDRFEGALDGGDRVLDAGCGAGVPFTRRLARRFDAVGLDLSREQLRLAREHVPGTEFLQGDMSRAGLAAGAFDGILALYSVIHLPREERGALFGEFGRLLGPGGVLLLTAGTAAWEGRNPDWLDAGVEMAWSIADPGTTRDRLRDAGFEIEAEATTPDDLGGEFRVVLARYASR